LDVESFMHDVAEGNTAVRVKSGKKGGVSNVRGGFGTASRTVGLLGAIFTYAVRNRMRSDNPVHGVMRPADGQRERRLSDDEYAALGAALKKAGEAKIWPAAVAAIRFLALTGWRSGEALALRWSEVDLTRRTATLADSKTGRSMHPLSHAACDVLRGLSQAGELVFPPTRGDGIMVGFRKPWNRIAALRGLAADVTPHVLRHSLASLAAWSQDARQYLSVPVTNRAESPAIPPEVREAVRISKPGNSGEQAIDYWLRDMAQIYDGLTGKVAATSWDRVNDEARGFTLFVIADDGKRPVSPAFPASG
jgi:hypothetical protein